MSLIRKRPSILEENPLTRLNSVTYFQNRIGNDREVQSKLVATYRGFFCSMAMAFLTWRFMMLFSSDRTITLCGLML